MSEHTTSPFQDPVEKARGGDSPTASEGKKETTECRSPSNRLVQPPAPALDRRTEMQPCGGFPQAQAPQSHEPPDIDSIDAQSDMRAFMTAAVSESLRSQALRKWFHLPVFNRRDGLDDYDGDYRGFTPLGQVVTAHLKHQLQRPRSRGDDPGAHTSDSGPLPASGRNASTTGQAQEARAPSAGKVWNIGRGQAGADDPAASASAETTLLWDAARCAHGSDALPGCIRCQEACPGGAIFFDAQDLQIRLEHCRGQGSCVAVCPTGALRPAADEIAPMLKDIRTLAEAGAKGLSAVFCSVQTPAETLQRLKEGLPEPVLELPSRLATGLEVWLAALAMGACRVVVLGHGTDRVQQDQLRLARAILAGLNLDAQARLLGPDLPLGEGRIDRPIPLPAILPAAWEPAGDKRALLWQAIEHLYDQFPGPSPQVLLHPGAPLGEIRLDPAKCTLCLACVGACPTGALLHGTERPQVRFRERDCIQCGLCDRVCPEQAVTLSARICYDRHQTHTARILHQAEVLGCSICGAPFASREMVDAITRKLAAHWMYQDPSARARLRMCRDCRIRSIYESRQQSPAAGGTEGKK